MSAENQDIEIGAGDTLEVEFAPILDQNGLVIDLTTAVVIRWWMGLSSSSTGTNVKLKKTIGNGLTLLGNQGVLLLLNAVDTASLLPGIYYHEYEVILPDTVDVELTPTTGKFAVDTRLIRNQPV